MQRFWSTFSGASLLVSALMFGAQESAYGSAIAGDREPCGSAFSALNYQTNDDAARNVYGAATSAWPGGFIENDVCRPWLSSKGIGDNVRSRRVGNNRTQGKSGESHGGPIWLGLLIPSDAHRLRMNVVVQHRVVEGFAFGDIDETVKSALIGGKDQQTSVQLISLPRINRNIYASSITPVQRTAWQEFFNYVPGRNKSSVISDKKSSAMDTHFLGRIEARDRSNRGFDFSDSIDESVVALSDNGRSEPDKTDKKKEDDATSRTITLDTVNPYSARCKTTIRNDVWDVQCPKDTDEVHIEAYPAGAK